MTWQTRQRRVQDMLYDMGSMSMNEIAEELVTRDLAIEEAREKIQELEQLERDLRDVIDTLTNEYKALEITAGTLEGERDVARFELEQLNEAYDHLKAVSTMLNYRKESTP
jgi:chromosome segregation ATPase